MLQINLFAIAGRLFQYMRRIVLSMIEIRPPKKDNMLSTSDSKSLLHKAWLFD